MSDLFSLKTKKTIILEELQVAMNRTAVGAARNSLKIKDISRRYESIHNSRKRFNGFNNSKSFRFKN